MMAPDESVNRPRNPPVDCAGKLAMNSKKMQKHFQHGMVLSPGRNGTTLALASMGASH